VKKYYSGYIVMNWNDKYGEPPYKGKFFTIDFGVAKNGPRVIIGEKIGPNGSPTEVEGKEAIIETGNMENAIKVSELMSTSIVLLNSYILLTDRSPAIVPFSEYDPKKFYRDFSSMPEIQLATKMACKASFRKAYYYALFKYRLGCELWSTPTVDLDPNFSLYNKISSFPSDHARLAYAIILFYSVIEELGLEIRASSKNPSFSNGKWNLKVKEELETRLKKQGININEPFYWNLRSTPAKLERGIRKKNKLKPIKKAEWAKYDVRDSEIPLVDAILLASLLRSRVAAHKFSSFVRLLSIYDVSNVNILARRLLLEKLGFWYLPGFEKS
jgi:hypothetical protein